mmetsp:Transcript_8640/g.15845  ORF Transcript_8640/g.15845 Transcript_8640/m.15845 type:complete len:94 (+) Transcript_8640:814-1095(+)
MNRLDRTSGLKASHPAMPASSSTTGFFFRLFFFFIVFPGTSAVVSTSPSTGASAIGRFFPLGGQAFVFVTFINVANDRNVKVVITQLVAHNRR